jgi:hypothetical protein
LECRAGAERVGEAFERAGGAEAAAAALESLLGAEVQTTGERAA